MSDVSAPPPEPHFDTQGLVPAIAQDATTNAVLTLAYMNREAWQATLRTGRATFWSRSRQELWEKGATSGNTMHVRAIRLDCDRDTVLLLVDPDGPACHTGSTTCFFEDVATGDATG
jgi:phosphoribosyl-AMP cyclohydrolase